MQDHAHSVTVVRTTDVSAEDLYAAWTEPELMRRWMATIVEADVRVGGRYRIETPAKDAVGPFTGEYRVLEPARRVVQTFSHVATEPGTYTDEFVEVTFRPLGPALTELKLTNSWNGLGMTDEERALLGQGWSLWLDRLEAVFSRPDRQERRRGG